MLRGAEARCRPSAAVQGEEGGRGVAKKPQAGTPATASGKPFCLLVTLLFRQVFYPWVVRKVFVCVWGSHAGSERPAARRKGSETGVSTGT